MSIHVRLLALWLVVFVGVGCATTKNEKTEEPTVQQGAVEPAPNAKAYVKQAASWFPADTFAVGAMTAEQYWDFAASFFPKDRRDMDSEKPGTLGGLRADISAMLLEEVGIDFTGLDGAVIGAGHDSGGVVLFGDIALQDERFEPVEVAGREVMRFEVDGGATSEGESLWMVPFDEPEAGLAIFYKKSMLEKALKARYSDSESDASMTSGQANFDIPLFDDIPAGSFVGFMRADERLLEEMGQLPIPAPDRVAFSYGDALTLMTEGSTESLDAIAQWASRFRAMAEQQVERLQRRIDTEDMPESLGALVGYHYAYAYLQTFEEERADGRLTYSMAVPDTGASFMGPGVLASIAIPAFIKYIKRSKAAEADAITAKLADGAKSYFTSEQAGCGGRKDCASPWHSNAQAGVPVPFKDYVFPGGPDVHVVSMDEPPKEGVKSTPDPQFGARHSSKLADVEPVLDALGVTFSDPMYFQYSYETGPGTGVDATAKILAFADLDGNGEPFHTLEIRLEIDPTTKEVQISPAIILNEFE